jgi:hypothetical protein
MLDEGSVASWWNLCRRNGLFFFLCYLRFFLVTLHIPYMISFFFPYSINFYSILPVLDYLLAARGVSGFQTPSVRLRSGVFEILWSTLSQPPFE